MDSEASLRESTLTIAVAFLAATISFSPVAAQLPMVELQAAATLDGFNFTRVRGLLELPDGRLLVADQTEKAVWRVDLVRGTREQIGSVGAGPQEFESPTGVFPYGAGRALVVDFGNSRLAVLDSAQRMTTTLPLFASGRSLPDATDDQGRMYFDDVSSVRLRKREDPRAEQAWVIRWSEGAGPDSVAPLRIPGGVNPGPFADWDRWAVDRQGNIVVVRNQEELRVDWYRADGTSVQGPVVDRERFPLGRAEQDAWLRDNPGGMAGVTLSREGEEAPARRRVEIDFPDHLPFARGRDVWIDAQDRAWVGRYAPADDSERPLHDLFDASGRRVAQVRLPAGREIVGFGARGLYAVRRDEFDLLWLERYDLSGLPGASR